MLAALAAGGRRIALDAQGPLRLPQLGPLVLGGTLDAALLRHVQALKLSEEEAQAAFGTIDAGAIRAALRRARGARHVRIPGRSRRLVEGASGHVAAAAVTDIDPTGAGDAFLAAYAHARAAGRGAAGRGRARACEHVSALFAARADAERRWRRRSECIRTRPGLD